MLMDTADHRAVHSHCSSCWRTIALFPLLAALICTSAIAADPLFVINEIHADPDSIVGDANQDGQVSTTEDEFIEFVNVSGVGQDISGFTLSDTVAVRHEFAAESWLPAGCAVVVFGGGTPTGDFGSAQALIASSGSLSLNNGGEDVTLADADGQPMAAVSYGSQGGGDQSITRDPDLTGEFVQHTTVNGGTGPLFSPGTRVDGAPFAADCESLPPTDPPVEVLRDGFEG
jgi:hypothetical protein